jgi:hypothetical protein
MGLRVWFPGLKTWMVRPISLSANCPANINSRDCRVDTLTAYIVDAKGFDVGIRAVGFMQCLLSEQMKSAFDTL